MSNPHTLYLVTGMPAVGKTTFAKQLARHISACLIDIDTSTEEIIRAAMNRITGDPNDRDSPEFKRIFRDAIYANLFSIADANLPHVDAVVTGPFTKEINDPNWPREIQQTLKTTSRIKCIFLHCPPTLRRHRLEQRNNPRDKSKQENWDEHVKYYTEETFPAYPHFNVDTGKADAFERAIKNGLLT